MRFTNIFKIVLISSLLCFNSLLFAQENNSLKVLEDAINELSMKDLNLKNIEEKFNSSEASFIYDIAFDKTNSFKMRFLAVQVAAFLNLDNTQITRITQYITKNYPAFIAGQEDDEIVVHLKNSVELLYMRTKNDKLLRPLRDLCEDDVCNDKCKGYIMQVLIHSDSPQNIPFYQKILKDRDGNEANKAMAVFGLAQSGSLASLPYLSEMVHYLFATEKESLGGILYLDAINALEKLSSKHYRACKEIQDVITEVCNCDKDQYGYMLKIPENVNVLFKALQNNNQEPNRKYLEDLLDSQCKYQNAKAWAIETLGFIGNEGTIALLEKYDSIYPNRVEKATAQILGINLDPDFPEDLEDPDEEDLKKILAEESGE